MDKQLDLVKILSKVPKGIKLYSLIDGEVTFKDIKHCSYPILVTDKFESDHFYSADGKYRNTGVGECILFPSKECRDWSRFKVDLPEGTPVFVSDDKKSWMLRFYHKYKRTYNAGSKCGDTTPWRYIIPVDKFNFTDCSFNKEDNYGMAVD